MPAFDFMDVRQFRVKLPDPLFPYAGKASIVVVTVGSQIGDRSDWLGIDDLSEHFTQSFAARNPSTFLAHFMERKQIHALLVQPKRLETS